MLFACSDIEAQDFALAGFLDADGDDDRLANDAMILSDFEIEGIFLGSSPRLRAIPVAFPRLIHDAIPESW